MSMLRKTMLAALSCSTMLSGCAFSTVGEAERVTEAKSKDAGHYLDDAKHPLVPTEVSPVKVIPGTFTSATARRSDHGDPLPHKYETVAPNPGITIVRAAPVDLFEIGSAISAATHIPVQFAPDVFPGSDTDIIKDTSGAKSAAGGADATSGPGSRRNAGPDLTAMLGQLGLSSGAASAVTGNTSGAKGGQIMQVAGSRNAMKVNHSGKLSTFLDQVCSYFGVAWTYTDGTIHIFRNVTRTFTVHALPSAVSLSATTDSTGSATASSGGGGGSGSSNSGSTVNSSQTSKTDVSIKIWDEMQKAIESIVNNSGKVTSSVSTGTMTVVAPADVMERVQQYVDGQNIRLSRQVSVSVQVLSLQLKDSDNLNFSLQGVFNKIADTQIKFGNAGAAAATQLVSGSPGIGIVSSGSRWGGTNGVMSALAERGRVSVVTTASVTTLNGIPVPLQVVNTRNYLQSISVTAVSGSGSSSSNTQTQLTPGTVTTGFNMSLLPHVVDDGSEILMQFGINISELVGATNGFDEFGANGETIQLPNVNSRNFIQQARVPNGSTLVLTGYEQTNDTADRQGAGSPDFFGLGGSQNGSRQRDIIIILLTPVLLSSQTPVVSSN
jgi:type IVB pilus formation R64 PilN family outer membrane protein